jgi:hypothetical protein
LKLFQVLGELDLSDSAEFEVTLRLTGEVEGGLEETTALASALLTAIGVEVAESEVVVAALGEEGEVLEFLGEIVVAMGDFGEGGDPKVPSVRADSAAARGERAASLRGEVGEWGGCWDRPD